uniref:RHS repeat-associated core domain-containing protein n=1 Tax=Pseudomonas sp. TaxID=306 RepID=UPI002601BB64
NRSLFMADADNPPDLSRGFDANGNLLQLEGVQVMSWDARNQLQRVTQVQRADGSNDDEVYVYGGDGQRRRKVRVQQAKALIHVAETRYLPGLEIRTNTAKREVLHVATVQAGRCNVRRLYWHQSRNALPNPQLRYSLDDQRESSVLELDGGADVISHEGYYPYGGTAWWAARSQAEADYKTVRYSGKERDATGLYYYGFRYYAPWLQRWINPDPAGDVDGLNVYLMVKCNPITLIDNTGLLSEAAQEVRSKIDRHKKILSVITSRTIDIERTIQNHESWISRLLEAGGRVANILTKGFIRGAGGAVGAALGGVAGAIVGGALGALIGTSLGKKQIAKRAGKYFNNIMKAHGIQPRRINLTGNELDPDHVIVSALSKDKSSKTPDKIFKKITKKIIAPLGGKLVKTLGVDVLSLPEEYWAASHKITDDKLIAIDADISVLSGIVKARVVDLNKEINALGDDASSLSVDKQNLSEESQLLLQTLVTTKEVIGAYRISSLPHNLR